MKKLFAFVIALVMIAGQLTGLSALAENVSDSAPHIRFNAEDGLSVEEYNRKKSEFINQMIAARSITPATFSLRSTVSGNTLSNEYIEFAVDSSTGRFTVGTVAGNPALSTDDNKVMLYGHSSPWSSYTTVRVDGESYIYGDNGFVVSPYFDGDANYSKAAFGNIHVQQEISIVENSSTHRDDIVEIKYVVTNTGNSTASLGLRVMMDTMLGSNDAAPFRVPGHGDLTSEKEFVGDNIPQYWQAFDDLNNPKVVSHGNFLSGAIKPNKVQFTNWSRVYNTPWDYHVSEGSSNGDSAVSVIWERSLAAGAQETYVTRYGLSELVQDLRPPLGLTIASGSSILPNAENDGYLPYPITIYVQNVGSSTAKNVACTIDLPNELVFADTNQNRTMHLIGTMEVGSVVTIEKVVYVKALHNREVNTQFQVSVTADDTETKILTKQVTIGAVETVITEKTGQFKYAGFINQDRDSTATYFYSDSYFDGDATVYNQQLATMSLCLELSAWSSFDTDVWPNKSKNAHALLKDIGFTDIEQNSAWNQKPSMHSLGAVAAHKNIGNTTVVALAIRGGGYYDEWGGNFVLGSSGNHEGFENGRDEAYSFLNSYVQNHKSEFKNELKVWIVGFSRGGAVANMTAGKLTDVGSCGGMALPAKNIFAYTFEAPQGYVGSNGNGYKNIHNQVNSMDIVPLVAPSVMGFKRYNTNSNMIMPTLGTRSFDQKVTSIRTQFNKVLAGIPDNPSESYNPSPYAMQIDLGIDVSADAGWNKWQIFSFSIYYPYVNLDVNPHWKSRNTGLTVDTMLRGSVDSVFGNIPGGRVGYVNNVEHALSNLIRFFMGYNNEIDWSAVMYDAFFANYAEGARKVTGVLLYPFSAPDKKIADAAAVAAQLIADSALTQTGTNLSEVMTASTNLLKAVFSATIDDPQQLFGFLYYLIGDNGFQPHWPEISLAAMMAVDSNYSNSARSVEANPQSYRIVQINCPVDVVVYDDNQQVMSQIIGDTASNTSQVHGAFITEDGTKQIVLPSDAAYTIRINATGVGEMSVSVLEYNSALQQYTLLQGWQSISINTGDSFVADIPAYALEDYNDLDGNGSATAYKLTGPKGRAIEPTLRLTGNNVEYHQVTLTSNNQKGVVTGGGQFVTSSFAQVQAIPMPTVEFLGWYLNGTCVSTDATYRFAVNDDVNLVAHFSEGNFNKLSVKATAGGRVNIDEMHLPESVEVQLIAEPEPGFEFDRWEVTAGSVQNAQSITTIFTMPASDASITAVFKNSNALTITQQPTDQFVVVGQTATFSIGATGDNLTYQWYIDRNNGRGWRKLDNAIGSEYTTSVVDLECDGFKYYCKVTDQYGNTINSNEAVLHVTTAPILPETGDSSTPMLWLALSMLSMLGILLMRKKAYSK